MSVDGSGQTGKLDIENGSCGQLCKLVRTERWCEFEEDVGNSLNAHWDEIVREAHFF